MHKPLILIGSFLLLFNIIETTSIAKCSRNDRKSIELETTSGKLLGQCDFVKVNDNNPRAVKSGNVYSWLGVPYAEPPINQYRFKSPVEVRTRTDPIDATKWPNSCVPLLDTSSQYQVPIFNGYKMWFEPTNTSEYSEDCLYLNIWLPAEAYLKTNVFNYNLEPTKSPIMVFFHGGGTIRGSTSIDIYNPATFVAATNTIVITVNYRLGLFGNFYLDGEFPGNQALLDQNEALRWVRNNADAMGGDPNKITIYGHSSGAVHVGYHLFFKDSWQLFNNAILQSGTPLLRPLAAISREEANLRSREILNLIGCLNDTSSGSDAAQCAQNALHINKAAVDYNKKLSNSNRFVGLNILTPFVPVIDGRVLKDSPENLLARGEYKRCPVMIGYLIDEGSMFAGYSAQSPSEESIRKRPSLSHKQLKTTLKDLFTYYPRYPHQSNHLLVDTILHEYTKIIDSSEQPKSALIKPNYFHILSKIIGDAFFVCPAYKMIDLLASNSPKNLYLYLFAHRISSTPWPSWYGATHGDELAFTFAHTISERDEKTINGENPWANPRHRYSSGEKLLTNEMITYWSSFAKTDSPNSKNLVHWPEYTLFKGDFQSDNMSDVSESVRYIIFKSTGIRVNRGYSLEVCQFWNYYIDHLIEENDNQVKSRKCDVSTTNNRQIERPSALKERAYNDKNTNLNNNSQRIEISRFFLLFFVSALYFVLF